jgi:PadR family transcriptional regulator PadR
MISKALTAASYKPIVLSILSAGEMYGYQIIQRVQKLSHGKIRWTAGTLYPLLHSLETEGLVESTWRMSEAGRERKYYQLTPKGAAALEAEKSQWLDVHDLLVQLWDPGLATR